MTTTRASEVDQHEGDCDRGTDNHDDLIISELTECDTRVDRVREVKKRQHLERIIRCK